MRPIAVVAGILAACALGRAAVPASGVAQGQAPLPGQSAPATAVVAGQITDGTTGRPVGGATVILAAGVVPAAQTSAFAALPATATRRGVAVAGADGRFVFRDVPAGSYSITATLEGYAQGATGRRRPGGPGRTFTVADGARPTDANVAIWRLAAVSGYVRDDRGQPVVGVAVSGMRRVMNGGRLELTFTGGSTEVTDDRGFYRLNHLMPGAYVVNVRTTTQTIPVALSDTYQAAVASGTSTAIRQRMSETGALMISGSGLVVDDWQVSVSIGQPMPLPGPDGTLFVHPATFYPGSPTPAGAEVVTLGPGDDRSGVDLRLPLVAGMRVSGVIRGPDGPAANHGVRLFPATDDLVFDVPVAYATTDAAGQFALLGVPPGAYVARAYRAPSPLPFLPPVRSPDGSLPGGRADLEMLKPGPPVTAVYAEARVAVGAGHVDGLALTLEPGARISGRIVFEGSTPAPPASRFQQLTVTVRELNGSTMPAREARLDTEGRFVTQGFPPGRYVFGALPVFGPEWRLSSIRVAGAESVGGVLTLGSSDLDDVVLTFTDRKTAITGTVHADGGGESPDAAVVMFPANVQEWVASGMSPFRVSTVAPSASGEYAIPVMFPGDYLVVAVPPDIDPEVTPEFAKRHAANATRVSIAVGESKTVPLTLRRAR